jgi:uncharacterized protein YecT (DUF1311 family)
MFGAMDDDYFDALRRTGDAWEAYRDAANSDAQSKRCGALWAEWQRCVVKLTSIRDSRHRG